MTEPRTPANLHRSPSPTPPPSAGRSATATLHELGEEIALLSARIHAATYQLLVLLSHFDEAEGWEGFRSCAAWLSWRTGLESGAAREKVRVARALGELPGVAESMARGEISYSKVRALTRVATPENEGGCLQRTIAHSTPRSLARLEKGNLSRPGGQPRSENGQGLRPC